MSLKSQDFIKNIKIKNLKPIRDDSKDCPNPYTIPFKFLNPYTIHDREIFFGREMEIRELYYKVFSNRISIVCGASGTGKTSIVQCGFLSEAGDHIAFLPIRSAIDPIGNICNEIDRISMVHDKDIANKLQKAYFQIRKTIVLFFDQFEEVFTQLSSEKRENLIKLIKNICNIDADIRIIINIREDYFAKLSEFEREIPFILENKIYISKIAKSQAVDIAIMACMKCNIQLKKDTAKHIMDSISLHEKGIELPLFQVVMDNLYRKAEKSPHETEIIYDKNPNTIKEIIGDFLSQQIEQTTETNIAKEILKALVHHNGTRRLCSIKELVSIINKKGNILIVEDKADIILRELIDLRIIIYYKDSGMYELLHDYLAERIYLELLTGEEREAIRIKEKIQIMMQYDIPIEEKFLMSIELMEKEKRIFFSPDIIKDKEISQYLNKWKIKIDKEKKHKKQLKISIIALVFILLSGFSILSYNAYRRAVKEKVKAEQAQIEMAAQTKNITRNRFFLELSLKNRDLRKAEDYLLALKKEDPHNPDIFHYKLELGKIYLNHSNFQKTIELLAYYKTEEKAEILIKKAERKLKDFKSILNEKQPGMHYEMSIDGISLFIRYIPSGEFYIGSHPDEENHNPNEQRYKVKLERGFWIMEKEVNQKLYETIMDSNPSIHIGHDLPVHSINWYDAMSFCKKLSVLTGKDWTLPTEAEWEYACRAGTDTIFSFGDSINNTMAQFNSESMIPSGSFKHNKWGLYDMHGNIAEWCYDWYDEYNTEDILNPKGPSDGHLRVIRGGNWGDPPHLIRSASRKGVSPYLKNDKIGFRAIFRE